MCQVCTAGNITGYFQLVTVPSAYENKVKIEASLRLRFDIVAITSIKYQVLPVTVQGTKTISFRSTKHLLTVTVPGPYS
jgi:hypothetical protein